MKIPAIVSLTFLVLMLFIGTASAQEVTASLASSSVKRGGRIKGEIVLTIPAGVHVNTNKPRSPYAIPTTVTITAPQFIVSGPRFPAGHDRKFGFSDELINVYEGRVVFPFSLRASRRAKRGTAEISIEVRFQACTEEVCYPPRDKRITLEVSVR